MTRAVQVVALLLACVCMYGVGAQAAGAAVPDDSWTYPCGGASNLDYATCERLNYVAQAERDSANSLHEDVWVLIGVIATSTLLPMFLRIILGGKE
jgi:hypothetical protein